MNVFINIPTVIIEALLLSLSSHARWVFSCDCMTEYFIILILLSNDYVRSLSSTYLQQRLDHLCGTQHAGDGVLTATVLRLLLGPFGRFGLSFNGESTALFRFVSSFPLLVDF